MLKISLSKLDSLFELIGSEKTLYLPIEKAGQVQFYQYEKGAKVRLDALQTVKSPKDLFFPQSECYARFQVKQNNISIEAIAPCDDKFVIFGVRACDAKSFELLDRVFLSEPVDAMYRSRRENGVVVTLSCNEPEETCFCKALGIDAAAPAGDVSAAIVGDELMMEARTEKGKELCEKLAALLTEADSKDIEAYENNKKAITEIINKLPYSDLDMSAFENANELEMFKSDKWEELSEACLGCGTCTFVCPTCQCYDIRDFDTGSGVTRFRCWDSCMYSEFTQAAGHNPRTTQMERFRQRFMHKLVYFPKNNDGEYSCVGCGRCMKKCPVSLNIVKVIKGLGGNK